MSTTYEWTSAQGINATHIGNAKTYRAGSAIIDSISCVMITETENAQGTVTEKRTPLVVNFVSIKSSRSDIPSNQENIEIDGITIVDGTMNCSVKGTLIDPFQHVTHLQVAENGKPLSHVVKVTAHEYKKNEGKYYDMSSYKPDMSKTVTYTITFSAGASLHSYLLVVRENWTADANFVKNFDYHT